MQRRGNLKVERMFDLHERIVMRSLSVPPDIASSSCVCPDGVALSARCIGSPKALRSF